MTLVMAAAIDFSSNTMAWRSSGTTNLQLVSNMKRNGLIKSERVITVGNLFSAPQGFVIILIAHRYFVFYHRQ